MEKKHKASTDDGCEHAKEVVNKLGYDLVCDEQETTSHHEDDNCDHAKEVASRFGFTVICDDEEE